MAEVKIVGYKKIFGLILPDWVSEKMMKLFVGGLLSILFMLVLAVFYVRPMYDGVKILENSLASEEKALKSLRESKSGIDKLREELTDQEQTKILASVPDNYSPDTAIFILREIANETGVSIVSYSLPSGVLLDSNEVQSTTSKNDEMVSFSSYPIKIVIAAPVEVLLKFINKVETSLPYGVVSDLNLQEVTKLSKQSQNRNVQIAMELRYYQAKLGRVNINKIQALTDENLETVKSLSGYDLISITKKEPVATSSSVATGSGDMFGF